MQEDHDELTLLPTSIKSPSTSPYTCPRCTTTTKFKFLLEGSIVTASSLLFNAVFHNPMCGLVFNCGCSFNPWLGGTGWNLCNVHNPNPNSPRCPWCISPRDTPNWTWVTSSTCVVVLMVAAWFVVGWKMYQTKGNGNTLTSRMKRRVAPIAWFLIHHTLSGLIFAIATGYPYFFFFKFANHQTPSPPLLPILPNITNH